MKRSLLAPMLEELRNPGQWSLWQLGLAVLSLDRTRPFWDEMGLRFRHPNEVQSAVRRFVRAQQELPGHEDSQTYGAKIRTLTRRLLSEIAELEGDGPALGLWNWFLTAYAEEPKWHWMWRILLYHLQGEAPLICRSAKPKARQLALLAESWADFVREVEARSQLARQAPLGRWDKLQYAIAQTDVPQYEPLDQVVEALERVAFDRHWAELVQLLGLPEMERLVRWGRETYAEIEQFRDDESRALDEILGERALAVRDAIVPPEWRTRN